MNRRSIFPLSAITALGQALLPASAVAQQKTLKEQLVGAWMLVSYQPTASEYPTGTLIFEAGGRYAELFIRPERSKFNNSVQPTTEERATTAQQGFAATFGTWSVSEADKTLTRHFDCALVPNNEGMDVKSSLSLTGDELRVTGGPGTGTQTYVYRRAK
jgi:hypothetical protein